MRPDVVELFRSFMSMGWRRSEDKVFLRSELWAEQIVKRYDRQAVVEDMERVGRHRLRAFFVTDAEDKGRDALTIGT